MWNTTGNYIQCLDNMEAIKKLQSTKHYEHRERHCPEEDPTCLIPIPDCYQREIQWPNSRDKALLDIAWGKQSRIILDVGCGVASFGGYLFERDVLTMSFAPKDEHEVQVQSAVMGTKRLLFPGRVYDAIHCARCNVPWHIEGVMLLLELNRLLQPGVYFVWSTTPVYRNLPEDVEIWEGSYMLHVKKGCGGNKQ